MLLLLLLVAGSSTRQASTDLFEKPFRVRDGEKFIDVDVGHAAPLYTDFDGDGVPDLLVGQFGEGKLRIYKNLGSAKEPRFDGFTWFKTGEEEGKVPAG
jgi:hypothetical protein